MLGVRNVCFYSHQDLIAFIEQLSSEKEMELSELRQKSNLILHHQLASDAYQAQMKLLQALVG